jgi:hypothetical protein
VLRHLFLPGTPLEEVYSDRAIAAKQDQNGQWLILLHNQPSWQSC